MKEHEQFHSGEVNWDDQEQFGPFGHRFPLVADAFAADWAIRQAAIERDDPDFKNPFGDPDVGTTLINDVEPRHVDAAVRTLRQSQRESDRALAGELLRFKQVRLECALRYPRQHPNELPAVDPDAEVQMWAMLIEGETSQVVLHEHWGWIGKDDDEGWWTPSPDQLQQSDFSEPLRRVHDELQSLLDQRARSPGSS